MNILKKEFAINKNSNYLDLVNTNKSEFRDNHYKKTLELWGKGNHVKKKLKHDGNDTHIEKLIETFGDKDFNVVNYLEIGCGQGIDLYYLLKNFDIKNIIAVDIGQNILDLSKRPEFDGVNFIRCDCLKLPFEDKSFNTIYSYGVFHHTNNFEKALIEAKRVLKDGGVLIFYSYKKHKNLFKRFGLFFENILLKIFSNFSYDQTKILCYLLTPIILLFFSYPAQLMKLFGFKEIYKNFPLWWGTSPKNIIHDLTDRLYAPINTRHGVYELNRILKKLNFSNFKVLDVRDGLFCRVVK